ncbi:hypothetical protein [Pseudomonas bohemica]|uniref:hypothetical protein n=1 Tax=Pseudomonas bohemica TaxID=2044872 RepID=UPI000DA5FB0E|nr:hypothetical protein [Pseudomonas bohemica]
MRGLIPANIGTICSETKVGQLVPLFRKGRLIPLTQLTSRLGQLAQVELPVTKGGNSLSTLALLVLCSLASLAHADQTDHKFIDVQHDSVRDATCWILNGRSIICLPDSQLRQPNPAPDRSQPGANPASTPAPRQHEEVFQL